MVKKKQRVMDYRREAGIARLREFEGEVLAKIPPLRFDIRRFVDEETVLRDPAGISSLEEYWGTDCGTVACAMGWAAMYPPFVELGFQVSRGESGNLLGGIEFWDGRIGRKRYGNEAVEEFFRLKGREGLWLFHGLSYSEDEIVDLAEVRERVREFLEREVVF
jgi:hypothetical protein